MLVNIIGTVYALVGLLSMGMATLRLLQNWEGFTRVQKTMFMGIIILMFGITERGLEIVLDHIHTSPSAIVKIIGCSIIFWCLCYPVDKRLWFKNTYLSAEDIQKYEKLIAQSRANLED